MTVLAFILFVKIAARYSSIFSIAFVATVLKVKRSLNDDNIKPNQTLIFLQIRLGGSGVKL